MTFTYTAGGTTNLNRIRARIGDTDSTAAATQRLEDEEINDFLTTEGGYRSAASASARALAAKFIRLASDKTVGSLRLVWQRRYEDLIALAKEMKASVATTVMPLAGGMSVSEKSDDSQKDDLVKPDFQRDMFDTPYANSGPAAPIDEKVL